MSTSGYGPYTDPKEWWYKTYGSYFYQPDKNGKTNKKNQRQSTVEKQQSAPAYNSDPRLKACLILTIIAVIAIAAALGAILGIYWDALTNGGRQRPPTPCDACPQGCMMEDGEVSCICWPGWEENEDGECDDIDECDDLYLCENDCINIIGSYFCECADGYQFNHGECEPDGSGNGDLTTDDPYETTTMPAFSNDTTCSESQCPCTSGGCVTSTAVCNGISDCPDGSDEANCTITYVGCPNGTFSCLESGKCVSDSLVCNGVDDCLDLSDELSCPANCTGYSCDNGFCVDSSKENDGVNDCGDTSDEKGFSGAACTGPFVCDNTRCVSNESLCNGVNDCGDLSDEANCDCPNDMFDCGNSLCINQTLVCDGVNSCGNGLDEQSCTKDCAAYLFQCENGLCVSQSLVCNGVNNCLDFSDEQGCNCSAGQFHCDTGLCIDSALVCDHNDSCGDASDERSNCQTGDNCDITTHYLCGNFYCAGVTTEVKCNGVNDCGNYNDETGCSVPNICTDDEFSCGNNICTPLENRCNGVADCGDYSDEMGCTSTRVVSCDPNLVSCGCN